jgi:sec-independent protein translocase protein TatA
MSIGPWQIVIIALLVILLFGRGKISSLMGDVAKGITSFRKGLKEGADELDGTKSVEEKKTIDGEVVKSADKEKSES